MISAIKTSFGKETASKYDYCCDNGHFTYQTSFDYDANQHYLKEDVAAGMLKKNFALKIFAFLQNNSERILKIKPQYQPRFLNTHIPQKESSEGGITTHAMGARLIICGVISELFFFFRSSSLYI